jgi:signal transduction histidine kinase
LLAGIALVGTLQGFGPFARQLPNPSLLVLDAFASTVALSAMVLAATMVAHRAAAAGLLSSTAQLVAAEERVRREIAERLHGRVQTELLVAGHRLGQVESLWQRDPAGALALLNVVRQSIDRVRAEDVRRASHLLHPGTIGLGLLPALRSLAASVSGELEVTVEADPAVMALDDLIGNRIPELVRLAAYRVVEEALANAIRHGGATAATVRVSATGNGGLALTVVDNGVGLDRAGLKPGLGFTMIAARVAQVQGAWRICGRPGVGTKLTVSLPLACRIAESA